MKDFLLAEYKTIILVLLFCGGVYAWFYFDELSQAKSRQAETDSSPETWTYTCLEPGKMLKNYTVGDKAPAFDDTWKPASAPMNSTSWMHSERDGNLVINVRNDRIRSIEFDLPNDPADACMVDIDQWLKTNNQIHEPLFIGNKEYQRYNGMTLILEGSNDNQKRSSVIIIPSDPSKNS